MANAALSNRERKALRKVLPKAPRVVRGDAEVRVATPEKGGKTEELVRDGLAWLIRKNQLTPAQVAEAKAWRDGVRDAGEVEMRSCLNIGVGGGSNEGALARVQAMSTARRLLFAGRYVVLRGQVDMLTVMDGVCGQGYTLRYLAGGDKHRAGELMVTLKLALDLLVAYRAGPPETIAQKAG
jgi:hypothetical protein